MPVLPPSSPKDGADPLTHATAVHSVSLPPAPPLVLRASQTKARPIHHLTIGEGIESKQVLALLLEATRLGGGGVLGGFLGELERLDLRAQPFW